MALNLKLRTGIKKLLLEVKTTGFSKKSYGTTGEVLLCKEPPTQTYPRVLQLFTAHFLMHYLPDLRLCLWELTVIKLSPIMEINSSQELLRRAAFTYDSISSIIRTALP
ncbi:MAG: hypothetical protein HOD92_00475 [Deltaproteobacteria bacterium]|jgi:hypothetical protein|nr:hypothetical protein [Deltaproteobacteria bacterium]